MRACVSLTFSAAHCIEGHPKCGEKHGHNYTVSLEVDGSVVKRMVMDFHDMKGALKGVTDRYDHKDIGDITSEELVERMGKELKGKFPKNVKKYRIMVSESDSSFVRGDWVENK
jgi:6-pyruvoyl tetrahydropterin synthase/QueD family protein